MVELVVVMVVIGIVAVVAMPKWSDRTSFDSRGFADQTLASLRYAQKSAISQRRTVCATFNANSVTLTIASAAGALACNTNLASPSGPSPYSVTANAGVAYSPTPTNFQFNSLGQASIGQTMSVSGASGTITVEQDTGYVHP